ncbi:MAG TPA: threonine/serine dehydratase [Vicinamibacterales bacterium]|nr:threonine/serine dehydratase [Vicinamibacterales bacterium]
MEPFVTLDEITAARDRIKSAVVYTPLLAVPWPSQAASHKPQAPSLLLKAESLQPVGAFKIRGAFNMIAQLSKDQLARGVITYSSGNHGQAVALAARTIGAPAVIVMPTTAPQVKVDGCKSYGAEVIMEGTTSLDRQRRAEQEAAARGLTMVPPFDHRQIIIGQGTMGLEILEQAPNLGTVVVPAGGGGMASGVAAAIKQSKPSVRVVAVEPVGAPKMTRSLEAGQPSTLPFSKSIADGLMNLRPGNLTFAHVQKYVDEVVMVEENDIAAAVAWLFRNARLVAEPSGAVTTAAVAKGLGHIDPANGDVVAVVSGGNVAPEAFSKYVAG